jgi:hypothetical protein
LRINIIFSKIFHYWNEKNKKTKIGWGRCRSRQCKEFIPYFSLLRNPSIPAILDLRELACTLIGGSGGFGTSHDRHPFLDCCIDYCQIIFMP